LFDIESKDKFLHALDTDLRLRILERDSEAATVKDVLRIACKLEAICQTTDDK